MDKLRSQVTLILVTLLAVLMIADAVECLLFGNRYDVPMALYGVVGTAVGGLYAPDLLRRAKNGDGKTTKNVGDDGATGGTAPT